MLYLSFQLLCIVVEEESDVAAFKDFVPTAADDQTPVGLGAKPDAEPAAPPPSPTPRPTTPAPPPPPPSPAPAAPSPPPPPPPMAPPSPAPSMAAPPPPTAGARVFATPFARTLAAEKGYDLSVSTVKSQYLKAYLPSFTI